MCGSEVGLAIVLALALADSDAAHELLVPAALRERSCNPEPSGIAWAASLERYLVVSDDTGLREQGSYHAPWLYAMSRQGALDAEPIPIEGLERINDLEAVTAGPEGTFFVTTSHSPSKHGKLKPERRMLLHLALAGRRLRVLGRADLTQARNPQGAPLAEMAGRLDVEGLAYRGGALYIGLKSPLAADGSATILRLDHPVQALAAGQLKAGALAAWATVTLRVPGWSGFVFEGISDMTFLPDGSLVLLANAPKGLPADGGGAVFWIPRPRAGALSAILLRRYPHLKPEGVSLEADGGALIIVLDRDQDQPLWTRLPLPH